MMQKIWFFFLLTLSGLQLVAQQPGQLMESGKAYFALYGAKKVEALRPFLAETSVFRDPTMVLTGPDHIISELTRVFSEDLGALDFKTQSSFVSGQSVVFQGVVDFTMHGKAMNRPEQEFTFSTPFVVTLKFEKGKVVEHVDYVDSFAFSKQLRSQMKAN